MPDQLTKAAGISSKAAKAKTGKSLDEWFALLDQAARRTGRIKTLPHLSDVHGCPSWWCQMIAVGYEQPEAFGSRIKAVPATSVRAFENIRRTSGFALPELERF